MKTIVKVIRVDEFLMFGYEIERLFNEALAEFYDVQHMNENALNLADFAQLNRSYQALVVKEFTAKTLEKFENRVLSNYAYQMVVVNKEALEYLFSELIATAQQYYVFTSADIDYAKIEGVQRATRLLRYVEVFAK